MYERLEAIVTGKVQGVAYRAHVERRARALHLQGEVENMSDGTVRVIAEGPRDLLEKLLKDLHQGSIQSEVKHIEAEWYPITYEFKSFTIVKE